jgi:hypothetical protein
MLFCAYTVHVIYQCVPPFDGIVAFTGNVLTVKHHFVVIAADDIVSAMSLYCHYSPVNLSWRRGTISTRTDVSRCQCRRRKQQAIDRKHRAVSVYLNLRM